MLWIPGYEAHAAEPREARQEAETALAELEQREVGFITSVHDPDHVFPKGLLSDLYHRAICR